MADFEFSTGAGGAQYDPTANVQTQAGAEQALGGDQQQPYTFDQALNDTLADADTQLNANSQKTEASENFLQKGVDAIQAAGLGGAKSVIETANTVGDILHLPKGPGIMNTPLAGIYSTAAELDRRSAVNGVADTTANFAIGLIGAGKIGEALKIGEFAAKGGKIGKAAYKLAEGAAAAGVAMDPHQARLSQLLIQVPALRNPVTQYLASDDDSSDASGRLKNALEGAGLDLALSGVLAGALKAYKVAAKVAIGKGDPAALAAAQNELRETVNGAGWGGDDQGLPVKQEATPPAQPQVSPVAGEPIPKSTATEATPNEPPPANGAAVPHPDAGAAEAVPVSERNGAAVPDGTVGAKPDATAGTGDAGHAVTPAKDIVDSVVQTARATGGIKGRIPTDTVNKTIDAIPALHNAPSRDINGVRVSLIPHKTMTALGKAIGKDTSGWLASANPKTGSITISEKLLTKSPKMQATVIAHEVGHTLQGQLEAAIKKAGQKLPQAELKAAAQVIRPEAHANADAIMGKLAAGGTGPAKAVAKVKALHSYLNSREEMFADSFALWKTDPAKMAEVAPQTKAIFDEHFQPWIDTDLTVLGGDIKQGGGKVGTVAGEQTATEGAPRQVEGEQPFSPRFQPEEPDVEEFLTSTKADQDAIDKFGSVGAAQDAGHVFAKANLPWQKLEAGGEGLTEFTARVASNLKSQLDELKGGDVLTDAAVEDMVKQRVKLFNEDPATVLGEVQAAGHNANAMVANVEAALLVADRMRQDLWAMQQEIAAGNFARWGGDEVAARAHIPAALAAYVETIGNAQAMRAAFGRGLRRMRGQFQISPEQLEHIRKLDPDEAIGIINMAGGNPRDMAKLATPGWWDTFARGLGTFFANNLLWSWKSHLNNTAGNLFMLGITPAMRAVGGAVLRNEDVRVQALREYRYMFSALDDARKSATETYLKGDSIIAPQSNEYLRANNTLENRVGGAVGDMLGLKQPETVGDVLHNTWAAFRFLYTQPTRALGAEDEFFKTLSYRASVMAKASVEADKLGLEGQGYKDYLADALGKAFDEEGRAINKDALYDAQVRTFSQPLLTAAENGGRAPLGTSFARLVAQQPLLRLVVPFVRTPINLFRYAIKLSPGLNLLQREYREALKGTYGTARQADAIGQMFIGSSIAMTAASLAYFGHLTGGGPASPQQQKALQDTGWRPYSVRVGNTYVPYNRLDPIGMLLGTVADIGEVIHDGQVSDDSLSNVILPVALAITHNLGSKSYLQGLHNAIEAISSNQQDAAVAQSQFLGSIANGLTPFSSLLNEVNPDPYVREARGIVDQWRRGIPGFSDQLPPRRDAFGAPILVNRGMSSSTDPNDVADAEQRRMLETYGIGITPAIASKPGEIDLRTYQLKDGQTAFDRLQDLSQKPQGAPRTMKEAIAREIATPRYQALPDGKADDRGSKLWALMRIVHKYRDAARKQLYRENPDLRAAIGQRKQAMRAAALSNTLGQEQGQSKVNLTVSNQLRAANAAFGIH